MRSGGSSESDPREPGTGEVRRLGAPAWFALLVIVALGAWLRLSHPGVAPAGLHPDEAIMVWNASMIAETGKDQHGVSWPLVASKGYGQGITTLNLYVLAPLVKLFGPSPEACRAASGALGVGAILLVFVLARAISGVAAGLGAALVLAVSPWHVQLSRWCHESSTAAFFVLLPLAVAHAAGLSIGRSTRAPSTLLAGVAGALFGVACYGYMALRVFVPVLLLGWLLARFRRGTDAASRRAAIALAFGFVVLFAPLALDFARSGQSTARARREWVWQGEDTAATRIAKVAARYPDHFSYGFLFGRGDRYEAHAPPSGWGLFPRYALVLVLAGAAVAAAGLRSDPAMRTLAVAVLVYPAADLLNKHPGAHLLRSSPGLFALTILAGVGMAVLARWVAARGRVARAVGLSLVVAVAATSAASFASDYFGTFDRAKDPYDFQVALVRALREVRELRQGGEAVVVSGASTWHPCVQTLVALRFSPEAWLASQRDYIDGPAPDGAYADEHECIGFDDFQFPIPGMKSPGMHRLRSNGVPDPTIFVVTPREAAGIAGGRVLRSIPGPRGDVAFVIVAGEL